MRTSYRVVLNGEDGKYILRDGMTISQAVAYAKENAKSYEGDLYVESYNVGGW